MLFASIYACLSIVKFFLFFFFHFIVVLFKTVLDRNVFFIIGYYYANTVYY